MPLADTNGNERTMAKKQPTGILYTLTEAAAFLKCSTRTLRRRITSGELKARKHKRRLLISASEVGRFVDSMPETGSED